MATANLTIRAIDALKGKAEAANVPQFLWDTKVTGFGVKASATGKVSWVVQKWVGGASGKAQRLTIGHYPAMDLDAARREAGAKVTDVHKGVNIVQAHKAARRKQSEDLQTQLEPTLKLFLSRKADPNSRYWHETERLLLTQVVPALGRSTPVATISKGDIRRMIEAKEDKHPGGARNLFAALRPFFKWCVERDIITASPMALLTPPTPCDARDRVLTNAELRVLWKATEAMPVPFGAFYRILLLTAQRRDEVAQMRKAEIDLDKGVWIIPKERTKNNREHLVHLSPQAVVIINGLPASTSDWVFTTTGNAPISGYSKAKDRLDQLCAKLYEDERQEFQLENFPPWRVHDLRRTAASGMAELGFQPHIVERVLNHISGAQGGLVGVYQRFEYAVERKRALAAWANHLQTFETRTLS